MSLDYSYCKIYIDTNLDYDELYNLIILYLKGIRLSHSFIKCDWCDIGLTKNKEWSEERYEIDNTDFIYWKYFIDLENIYKIDTQMYIKKIKELKQNLELFCKAVVISCDFEELL